MPTRALLLFLLAAASLLADAPPKSINPAVTRVVDAVSQERIVAILKKLESFSTRNTLSIADHPTKGIGAARKWIFTELQTYSPKLQVRYDSYQVKAQGRIYKDVELVNVVATLPGKTDPAHHFIISAHYDSMNMVFKTPATPGSADPPALDNEATAHADIAPGVTDDASGVAAVMELARIMSQYEWNKTIDFVAFAGEEQGLIGSRLFSARAKQEGTHISGVLNNDIIGSDLSGNGRTANGRINIYSEDPNDSSSRALARYIKEVGERYVPAMSVELVFRADRFARGGDHTPFNQDGFAAVRFTTPTEFFKNQHTATDTFANTSPPYITRVTKINAAVLASLALAPAAPEVTRQSTSGSLAGSVVPRITRGKSGYDAVLQWTLPEPEPKLAGFIVVQRSTLAPFWERELWVGNVKEHALSDVSIDDTVFGVKSVDQDGNESPVAAYVFTPRPPGKVQTVD